MGLVGYYYFFYDWEIEVQSCYSNISQSNIYVNPISSNYDTLSICSGDSVQIGSNYYYTAGTYLDTLSTIYGCDSIITLDLTINNSNTGTDTITACDSYTWIDGITYNTSNNTATHTLTNINGCDSVVTLDLNMNYSTTGIDVQEHCDSFIWIDGNTYTTSNNTATHILTNATGCDSVITLNLTINYTSYLSLIHI